MTGVAAKPATSVGLADLLRDVRHLDARAASALAERLDQQAGNQ